MRAAGGSEGRGNSRLQLLRDSRRRGDAGPDEQRQEAIGAFRPVSVANTVAMERVPAPVVALVIASD